MDFGLATCASFFVDTLLTLVVDPYEDVRDVSRAFEPKTESSSSALDMLVKGGVG